MKTSSVKVVIHVVYVPRRATYSHFYPHNRFNFHMTVLSVSAAAPMIQSVAAHSIENAMESLIATLIQTHARG